MTTKITKRTDPVAAAGLRAFREANPWTGGAGANALEALEVRWASALDLPGRFSLERNSGTAHYIPPPDAGGPPYRLDITGGCTCPDSRYRAPRGWCKHRLALWLIRQIQRPRSVAASQRAIPGSSRPPA